jgi:hypothetical protein
MRFQFIGDEKGRGPRHKDGDGEYPSHILVANYSDLQGGKPYKFDLGGVSVEVDPKTAEKLLRNNHFRKAEAAPSGPMDSSKAKK